MSYSFLSTSSVHEGGTKYYQVFIARDEATGRSVIVTHWDSYSGRIDPPKSCSETKCKIEEYAKGGTTAFNGIIRVKGRRGYNAWNAGENNFNLSATALAKLLADHLTLKDANAIFDYLDAGDPAINAMDDDELLRQLGTSPDVVDPPEPLVDRGESWGTW